MANEFDFVKEAEEIGQLYILLVTKTLKEERISDFLNLVAASDDVAGFMDTVMNTVDDPPSA